jgi:soluble lytic murein transglycosylase-like protein
MDVEALARATGAASSIARAADATGVDFSYLMNAAMRESAFKPNARNPKSSATGMFQFIEQTWLAMVKRHGGKHGLSDLAQSVKQSGDGKYYVSSPQQRREILSLRSDPETAAKPRTQNT